MEDERKGIDWTFSLHSSAETPLDKQLPNNNTTQQSNNNENEGNDDSSQNG